MRPGNRNGRAACKPAHGQRQGRQARSCVQRDVGGWRSTAGAMSRGATREPQPSLFHRSSAARTLRHARTRTTPADWEEGGRARGQQRQVQGRTGGGQHRNPSVLELNRTPVVELLRLLLRLSAQTEGGGGQSPALDAPGKPAGAAAQGASLAAHKAQRIPVAQGPRGTELGLHTHGDRRPGGVHPRERRRRLERHRERSRQSESHGRSFCCDLAEGRQ